MDDPIVQIGDPVLRAKAIPVEDGLFGSQELRTIVEQMKTVLAGERHGAALAAPQIGISMRIFIVAGYLLRDEETTSDDEEEQPLPEDLVCINPTLAKLSRKKPELEEGCLSVRNQYGRVPRAEKATVVAYDVDGTRFERGASGIVAQAFQHEIDHLDGILFIDKATEAWEVSQDDINEAESSPHS